jgi:hypothetical protein
MEFLFTKVMDVIILSEEESTHSHFLLCLSSVNTQVFLFQCRKEMSCFRRIRRNNVYITCKK